MALIKCPVCGREISNKSERCIHCGAVIAKSSEIKCVECGTIFSDELSACPVCGCPVKQENNTFVQSENQISKSNQSVRKKKNRFVLILIIVLIIIVGTLLCASVISENNKQKIIKYEEDLRSVTVSIGKSAADAVDCGNTIAQVWYNAIFNIENPETDAFTRQNGVFVTDFNTALQSLFSSESFSSKIESLELDLVSIQNDVSQLDNPPEDWKLVYDKLVNTYESYSDFISLVIHPTGTYVNFTTNLNNLNQKTSSDFTELVNTSL